MNLLHKTAASVVSLVWLVTVATAQQDDFRKLLEQGREAIAQARYGVAVEALRRATEVSPDSAYAHHLLALAYRGLGNEAESVEELCRALKKDRAGADIRGSVAEALKAGLPRRLSDEALKTLSEIYYEGAWETKEWDFQTVIQWGDPPARSYQGLFTTGTLFPPETPQRDPLHQNSTLEQLPDSWKFNRVTYGYLRVKGSEHWQQRVRVFYVSEFLAREGRDFSALSQMLCRMAVELCAVVQENMGVAPPGESEVMNIWLCESGEPGARQPLNTPSHIYFYDITHHRPWAEWLRELVHEFGHMVLPPIGGFTAAGEAIANGELGERLFLPWLRASINLSPADYRADDLAQVDKEFLPRSAQCVNLFAEEGPESPLLLDRGTWGVQLLCGFALWISETHSPAFLQQCFSALSEKGNPMELRAVDLRDVYQKLWLENVGKGISYHTAIPSPRFSALPTGDADGSSVLLRQGSKAGFWVYLGEGAWRIHLGCDGIERGVLTVCWSGGEKYEPHGIVLNPAEQPGVELEEITTGWRAVVIEAKNLPKPIRLRTLRFTKAEGKVQ